ADASATEIARIYTAGVAMTTTSDEIDLTATPRVRPSAARCTSIQVSGVDADDKRVEIIAPGATLRIAVRVRADAPVSQALLGVEIMDERGRPALGISTDTIHTWFDLGAGESR